MSQSFVGGVVPTSELVLRDVAFVSCPKERSGLSASEFLAFRVRRQSQFRACASPKDTLPAVFDELKHKASRMRFQRIGAKASTGPGSFKKLSA